MPCRPSPPRGVLTGPRAAAIAPEPVDNSDDERTRKRERKKKERGVMMTSMVAALEVMLTIWRRVRASDSAGDLHGAGHSLRLRGPRAARLPRPSKTIRSRNGSVRCLSSPPLATINTAHASHASPAVPPQRTHPNPKATCGGCLPRRYLASMCGEPLSGGEVGEGKSGMLFFFSSDGRYICKTLTPLELPFFMRILRGYFNYVMNNATRTLLPRHVAACLPRTRSVAFPRPFFNPSSTLRTPLQCILHSLCRWP